MSPSIEPKDLLARLDGIGAALRESGHAMALVALGSVGLDRERLDRCSDLDFFVVVEPGYKEASTVHMQDRDGNNMTKVKLAPSDDTIKVNVRDTKFRDVERAPNRGSTCRTTAGSPVSAIKACTGKLGCMVDLQW